MYLGPHWLRVKNFQFKKSIFLAIPFRSDYKYRLNSHVKTEQFEVKNKKKRIIVLKTDEEKYKTGEKRRKEKEEEWEQ